jgi:indolepyruvate ferredoxin oxidoreductase
LPGLTQANLSQALAVAAVADDIRGYGHIKAENAAKARKRWEILLRSMEGQPARLAA